MRPRLHLDFARPYARRTGVAALLLAAGLVAALAAGLEYRHLAGEVERLERSIADSRRLARRDLPRLRAAASDPKQLAEEVRGANLVLAQLTLPWDALFGEIEAAGGDGVALLSIQPDAAGGTVRLTGEARSYQEVLAYVGRLERREALSRVFLTSHELRAGGAQRPVAFAVLAHWREHDAVRGAPPGHRADNGEDTP
jgi:Tfp pilus assembly protein PilN